MLHRFMPVFQLPMIVSVAALTAMSPALAGDGNFLYIEQTASAGGLGNSLHVDQSQASGSTVAGASISEPATQHGGGNTGSVTLDGQGAFVTFNQTNPNPLAGSNTATIEGGSLASIVLNQNGFGNTGTLIVDAGGNGNSGTLIQNGNSNWGSVRVSGTDTTGILNQQGDSNVYGLVVTGTGSAVQWNQVGDGITPSTDALVTTNAGTVTVTQSTINN